MHSAHLWRMLGGFNEAFDRHIMKMPTYAFAYGKPVGGSCTSPGFSSSIWNGEAPATTRKRLDKWVSIAGAFLHAMPSYCASEATLLPSPWMRTAGNLPKTLRKPRILILDNEVPHMFKGGGPARPEDIAGTRPMARHLLSARDAEDDWRDVYGSLPRSVEVMLGYGFARLEEFWSSDEASTTCW